MTAQNMHKKENSYMWLTFGWYWSKNQNKYLIPLSTESKLKGALFFHIVYHYIIVWKLEVKDHSPVTRPILDFTLWIAVIHTKVM